LTTKQLKEIAQQTKLINEIANYRNLRLSVIRFGRIEMSISTSEWLTPEEAADHLKIKVRTLLLWVRQGKMKAFALSGTKRRIWRFRREDLDSALMQSPVLPSIPLSVRSERRMA
jgi:excisionase family DNA binding protein